MVADGHRTDDGDLCTLVVVCEVGGTWALYPMAGEVRGAAAAGRGAEGGTGDLGGCDVIPAGPGARVIPTGSVVIVKLRRGVRMTGLVVGPDQQFFPRPHSLFVQVGARTLLIAVADLEVVPELGSTASEGPKP